MSFLSTSAPAWATGLLLTGVEAFGDVALKKEWTIIGFGIYNLLAFILFKRLPSGELGLINAYWDAFSNIATAILGVLIFGEKYSWCQWGGFVLISLGILLLAYGDKLC